MTPRSPWLPILLGSTLLLAASSCSKTEDHPAPAAPKPAPMASTEITSEQKKGEPLSLLFALQQQDIAADGSRVLQVRGTYKGAEVGLIVVLGAKWESVAPDPKSKFAFHTGTVEYRTVGEPSNALLKALDELYGTALAPAAMRASVKFASTSLQGDPDDLAKGELRLKLSLDSSDPAQEAELYTNIDLARHQLRIAEKDQNFRKAIVRALAKE
jgi:hypothetical protein